MTVRPSTRLFFFSHFPEQRVDAPSWQRKMSFFFFAPPFFFAAGDTTSVLFASCCFRRVSCKDLIRGVHADRRCRQSGEARDTYTHTHTHTRRREPFNQHPRQGIRHTRIRVACLLSTPFSTHSLSRHNSCFFFFSFVLVLSLLGRKPFAYSLAAFLLFLSFFFSSLPISLASVLSARCGTRWGHRKRHLRSVGETRTPKGSAEARQTPLASSPYSFCCHFADNRTRNTQLEDTSRGDLIADVAASCRRIIHD